MARLPRLTVPGFPHHLIQRGNNRQAIFAADGDYDTLLAMLDENSRRFQVDLHAYVLMTNHFHVLATPATATGLPSVMQAVGRSYVRYFNQRQGRSGTLWEGRYRSTLIQADRYFLACMVYMDLNPVRAGIAPTARAYAWSSHRHYIGLVDDKMVTPHPLFWTLGNTPFAREAAYAELVATGVSSQQQQALTDSALRGWALGSADYVKDLQKRTSRRVSKARAGRPNRASGAADRSVPK